MRHNDLLDGAFDAPEPPKEKPKEWKRKSSRELDAIFEVDSGDYEDDIFIAKPIPSAPKKEHKPVKRRKRKVKARRVLPEHAEKLLDIWVKKLLLARRKVQKYRQAVKRYKKQGKI